MIEKCQKVHVKLKEINLQLNLSLSKKKYKNKNKINIYRNKIIKKQYFYLKVIVHKINL